MTYLQTRARTRTRTNARAYANAPAHVIIYAPSCAHTSARTRTHAHTRTHARGPLPSLLEPLSAYPNLQSKAKGVKYRVGHTTRGRQCTQNGAEQGISGRTTCLAANKPNKPGWGLWWARGDVQIDRARIRSSVLYIGQSIFGQVYARTHGLPALYTLYAACIRYTMAIDNYLIQLTCAKIDTSSKDGRMDGIVYAHELNAHMLSRTNQNKTSTNN